MFQFGTHFSDKINMLFVNLINFNAIKTNFSLRAF